METWRPVKAFPDYTISSLGRVRSVRLRRGSRAEINGGILKGSIERTSRGYQRTNVSLCKDGQRHVARIHHLVLDAFAGARPRNSIARHLNGNSLDNRAENLSWGSHLENTRDAIRHGTLKKPPILRGEGHHKATLSDEQVANIRALKYVRGTQAAMAKQYGVAEITISRIRRGLSR